MSNLKSDSSSSRTAAPVQIPRWNLFTLTLANWIKQTRGGVGGVEYHGLVFLVLQIGAVVAFNRIVTGVLFVPLDTDQLTLARAAAVYVLLFVVLWVLIFASRAYSLHRMFVATSSAAVGITPGAAIFLRAVFWADGPFVVRSLLYSLVFTSSYFLLVELYSKRPNEALFTSSFSVPRSEGFRQFNDVVCVVDDVFLVTAQAFFELTNNILVIDALIKAGRIYMDVVVWRMRLRHFLATVYQDLQKACHGSSYTATIDAVAPAKAGCVMLALLVCLIPVAAVLQEGRRTLEHFLLWLLILAVALMLGASLFVMSDVGTMVTGLVLGTYTKLVPSAGVCTISLIAVVVLACILLAASSFSAVVGNYTQQQQQQQQQPSLPGFSRLIRSSAFAMAIVGMGASVGVGFAGLPVTGVAFAKDQSARPKWPAFADLNPIEKAVLQSRSVRDLLKYTVTNFTDMHFQLAGQLIGLEYCLDVPVPNGSWNPFESNSPMHPMHVAAVTQKLQSQCYDAAGAPPPPSTTVTAAVQRTSSFHSASVESAPAYTYTSIFDGVSIRFASARSNNTESAAARMTLKYNLCIGVGTILHATFGVDTGDSNAALRWFSQWIQDVEVLAIDLVLDAAEQVLPTPFRTIQDKLEGVAGVLNLDYIDPLGVIGLVEDLIDSVPWIVRFVPLAASVLVLATTLLSVYKPAFAVVSYSLLALGFVCFVGSVALLYFYIQEFLMLYSYTLQLEYSVWIVLLDFATLELVFLSSYMLYTMQGSQASAGGQIDQHTISQIKTFFFAGAVPVAATLGKAPQIKFPDLKFDKV